MVAEDKSKAADKDVVMEDAPAAGADKGGKGGKADKKKKDEKEEELSEEDQKLKADMEMMVERLTDADLTIQKTALESMRTSIKSATSSMTSVPKPLKFLRAHYGTLKTAHSETLKDASCKMLAADIISVLAMTMGAEGDMDSLKYKLQGSQDDVGEWGHEYVRNLAREVATEFSQRQAADPDAGRPADLDNLIDQMVPYLMQHNAEHEACDLLIEVSRLGDVVPRCNEKTYPRVCLYLSSCAQYVPSPDDAEILSVAITVFRNFEQYSGAMRLALKLDNLELCSEILASCKDEAMRKQLGFQIARHTAAFQTPEGAEALEDVLASTALSESFLTLARDLDVMEPKTPDDIYSKATTGRAGNLPSSSVDSARKNLASTFVNAFVNAGFGTDKQVTTDGNNWIFKNKDHAMTSATASLGMIHMWDVDTGLSQIDRYTYSKEDQVKAGALLGIGVVNAGVKNDCDPALGLLSEYVDQANPTLRVSAILGLGIAYAGAARDEINEMLTPIVEDSTIGVRIVGYAALSLGLVYVGTCDADIAQSIMTTLMERPAEQLTDSHTRFLSLGLGLLFLGKGDAAEVTLEALKTIEGPVGKYAQLTVESCAFAGTGNVLKIQSMLHVISEVHDDEDADMTHKAVAVLGLALVAAGEDIGSEMVLRSFDHLLQYGDIETRRAVPLALGYLSASNPKIGVMDTLSKLTHDGDPEVAHGAILGLGMIGAGTNNSRIAALLRTLSTYYQKDVNQLFLVRIAQGLLYMGKGTMSLSPFHSDRLLMSPTGVAGLLTVLHAALDFKQTILAKSHFILYTLAVSMWPRMVMTFDEDLKPLPVSVRVGQAVDTVGQAGRPKTITGFQTNNTPVLLSYGDRAELATEEYIALAHVLEGFVVLRKNPDYKE